MKNILEQLINGESLSQLQAFDLIQEIAASKFNSEILSGILVALQMKGMSLSELSGFRESLLEKAVPLNLNSENAIDLCGTGGDGKNSFNISTTSAFVLAAMGRKVIKHGNYGVSSPTGSSNVLEALGISFETSESKLNHQLEMSNICFIHAPLFHPTLYKASTTRKNLGIRTIFNCLGPLVNPAQPSYQLTGTYSLELAKMYQFQLKEIRKNYTVVYGLDGFDEITLTNDTRLLGKYSDEIINAEKLNTEKIIPASLQSGNSHLENAKLIEKILKGEGSESQNKVVAINVAKANQLYNPQQNIQELYNESLEFIASGGAKKQLKLSI
jgi:anthranilate phosphoribosyltransferase